MHHVTKLFMFDVLPPVTRNRRFFVKTRSDQLFFGRCMKQIEVVINILVNFVRAFRKRTVNAPGNTCKPTVFVPKWRQPVAKIEPVEKCTVYYFD